MIEGLLVILLLLNMVILIITLILFRRSCQRKNGKEKPWEVLEKNIETTGRVLQEEIARNRGEANANARMEREELRGVFTGLSDSLLARVTDGTRIQTEQMDIFSRQLANLTQSNEQRLEKMRNTIEGKLTLLQEDNSRKLEQMRATVDEKLHATLEKRLGESFRLVSDRLEQVHKGLGEMQSLAKGVGDLKKVLTNVKTRGTWGEIQLGSLLEQILTEEQYAQNVATKKGNERVEFAIRLPGRGENDREVWLPVDAKFPQEDYQKLLEAQELSDAQMAEEAARQLENRIKAEAKAIKEKYLDPPYTTDFGIMFLPTEGLYAEVLRRPGLCETLQRVYRVVVTGPTTLAALLNSLQLGFRTLAIEKRSSEVWALLGAVKTEFGKFGDILDKTQKKLQEASNTIETAAKKTRNIERKLKKVQELPAEDAGHLLEDEEEDCDRLSM
ncbi:MAG: DNA recombination protein RmuC [Desulfitobacteriaceae bacterium]|nr:DNA recombination protein RmuC [Desulfitobacteriaceae bacterium]